MMSSVALGRYSSLSLLSLQLRKFLTSPHSAAKSPLQRFTSTGVQLQDAVNYSMSHGGMQTGR